MPNEAPHIVLARLLKRQLEEAREGAKKGRRIQWALIDETLDAMIEAMPPSPRQVH